MSTFVSATIEFLSGKGEEGKILGQELIPGDEEGKRPGEGYKKKGGVPMEVVGECRINVRPA